MTGIHSDAQLASAIITVETKRRNSNECRST
jgi:hypothetical protein